MNDIVLRPPGNGRGMLLLIVALLVLPFAVGGGLYVGGWHPPMAATHGYLSPSPLPLPGAILRSTAELRGKWLLILNLRGPCAASCTGRLDEMRRIQVALYKNMDRVRRVVLADRPDDPQLAALGRTQPDLLIVPSSAALPETEAPLLLADPQGLLIMTFPPDAEAQGIRADLERLLKFTWNG